MVKTGRIFFERLSKLLQEMITPFYYARVPRTVAEMKHRVVCSHTGILGTSLLMPSRSKERLN